jgi:hypothetical protein
LTEKNVIVTNGWSANGPDFVAKQTASLSLTNVFSRSPLDSILNIVQQVAGVAYEELKPEYLVLGGSITKDQVDRVPGDRVSGGIAPPTKPTTVSSTNQAGGASDSQMNAGNTASTNFQNMMANTKSSLANIQTQIDACAVKKQEEMWGNYYGAKPRQESYSCKTGTEEYCGYDVAMWACLDVKTRDVMGTCYRTVTDEYVKEKPGSSWTPKFDADYSCHGGLDLQISQLKNNFANDASVQQAQQACIGNSSAACVAVTDKVSSVNAEFSKAQTNRNALDTPFNDCNCAAGTGTSCMTTRVSGNYVCK